MLLPSKMLGQNSPVGILAPEAFAAQTATVPMSRLFQFPRERILQQ